MTLEEAAAALGLSGTGPFEREELRRAYHQAIKRHKPERDPAGFQRARQAYECLCTHADLVAAVAVNPPPEPAATPASPPPGAEGAPSSDVAALVRMFPEEATAFELERLRHSSTGSSA